MLHAYKNTKKNYTKLYYENKNRPFNFTENKCYIKFLKNIIIRLKKTFSTCSFKKIMPKTENNIFINQQTFTVLNSKKMISKIRKIRLRIQNNNA